jgi:oligopeptide/dipeptide ABC transporter ATP-binding protein
MALLEAMPRIGYRNRRAVAIHGEMPSPLDPPPGCVFHTRCPRAQAVCRVEPPRLEPAPSRPAQFAACHFKA